MDQLFESLSRSKFRSSFKLRNAEVLYFRTKGIDLILSHGEDFIRTRLAPGFIANDGKQTPYHGHPFFVAQHATACCCRSCLQKWHSIPIGHQLSKSETAYIISVVKRWLLTQLS